MTETDRNGQITDPNGPKRTAERAEMQLITHWRLILNGYVAETDHWRLILNGSVAETDGDERLAVLLGVLWLLSNRRRGLQTTRRTPNIL